MLCREAKKGFQSVTKITSQEGTFYKGRGSANIFGWVEGPAQGKKEFSQITLVWWRNIMVLNQADGGPDTLL